MRRDQPDKVVLVCKWNGHDDRFFGKYKCFESGNWRKIPGGVFPPEFKTRDDALMFATEWYTQEKIAHEARLKAAKKPEELTWDAICDAYLAEVKGRMRGKASTRHEAITLTNASIRKGVLARVKPADIDENLCLEWLRGIVGENIAKKGAPPRTRKPKTVRNIAKQLRYLFRVAIRRKLIPGMVVNPTTGDEFREELKALMALDQPLEWFLPADDFKKLVTCPAIPNHRRMGYLTMGIAGLRPGELAGLQFRHLKKDGDVRYISVEQQFTEKRAKIGGGEIESLKTKWAGRNVPVHSALKDPLDAWLKTGWVAWVGRAPQDDDFVLPRHDGKPFRQHDADVFRDDLVRAGCATTFNGKTLTPYSLRHLFSTLLQDAHAHDAAHDRLMGHRPKDTKTLNYSVKQLPFLAGELERVVFELPNDAPSFGAPKASDGLIISEPSKAYAA